MGKQSGRSEKRRAAKVGSDEGAAKRREARRKARALELVEPAGDVGDVDGQSAAADELVDAAGRQVDERRAAIPAKNDAKQAAKGVTAKDLAAEHRRLTGPCPKSAHHVRRRVYRTTELVRYCVCDDCGETWKMVRKNEFAWQRDRDAAPPAAEAA